MARQVEDIVGKRITQMSREELLDYVRKLRASRNTPKATAPRKKKEVNKVVNNLSKIVSKMSDAERAELIKSLEGKT